MQFRRRGFNFKDQEQRAGVAGLRKCRWRRCGFLAVHAYCLRRRALPSTFFRPAWPEAPRLRSWGKTWFAGVRIARVGGLGYLMIGSYRPEVDL